MVRNRHKKLNLPWRASEIPLSRSEIASQWNIRFANVGKFNFTWCASIKFHNLRSKLFHILHSKIFHSVADGILLTINSYTNVGIYTENCRVYFWYGICDGGFERRLLATVRWTVATAVAFPQKSESTVCRKTSIVTDQFVLKQFITELQNILP